MVTRLRRGRTHPTQVRVQNTSGRDDVRLRVTVTPGFTPPIGGFVQESPGQSVTVGPLRAGEEATARVFFQLPQGSPGGVKAFDVRVDEVDESGRLIGQAAEGTFTGLADLEELVITAEVSRAAVAAAPPGATPAEIEALIREAVAAAQAVPAAPTAADLAFAFQALLLTPTLELDTQVATPPRQVRGTITVPLSSPLRFTTPFRPTVQLFITRPGFQQRVSQQIVSVPPGSTDVQAQVQFSTFRLEATPPLYTFRVVMTDPSTGQPLLEFDFPEPTLAVLGEIAPTAPIAESISANLVPALWSRPAAYSGVLRITNADRAVHTISDARLSWTIGNVTRINVGSGARPGVTSAPVLTVPSLGPLATVVVPIVDPIDIEGQSVLPQGVGRWSLVGSIDGGPRGEIDSGTLTVIGSPTIPTVAAPGVFSVEEALRGLTLGPVQVQVPPTVVPSRVRPGTPITLSLPFQFPTPPTGLQLPEIMENLSVQVFLSDVQGRFTQELLDTRTFRIRPDNPTVMLPSFTLDRNAPAGPYRLQIFITDPFIAPVAQRVTFLPNFGAGRFYPANFSVEPLPTAAPDVPTARERLVPQQPPAGTISVSSFRFATSSVDKLITTNTMTSVLRNNNNFPALALVRIRLLDLAGRSVQALHPVATAGFPITIPPNADFTLRAPVATLPVLLDILPAGTYNVIVEVSNTDILDRIVTQRQFSNALTIRTGPAPAAPAPTVLAVPTPTPTRVGGPRINPGEIMLAGTRITASPSILRRGQQSTLDFTYNNASQAGGPTTINLRVIDRNGNIQTAVPRFRTSIQLRPGFGSFQVPFTAPTVLADGVYGIQLIMDRPDLADPAGPTPILEDNVLPVFEIRAGAAIIQQEEDLFLF